MKNALAIVCVISAMCLAGADKKQSEKKTSLSVEELRMLVTSVPDVKNASMLHSVAMATSNVDLRQEYLKAAAACLIACDKKDIYVKHIKSKLLNAKEFESELKDECKQCSGGGTKDRRCTMCNGKGKCTSCKGSGRTASYGFDRPKEWKTCRKCDGSGQCNKCGGNGSNKETCMTCAGTGKTFSKTIAASVYRDLCNSISDCVAAEARSKADIVKHERKRIGDETRTKAAANDIANTVTEERERGSKDMCVSADSGEGSLARQDVVNKQTVSLPRRHETGGRSYDLTSSALSLAGPVKDGFGTEIVDGVAYSYKIENGEAMIGVVNKGFTAAVKNEPEGVLVVPSKLGGAPVKKIGFAAFYKTKSSEIVLPNGIIALESCALSNAKASRIVIPSSVRSVAYDALSGTTWEENQKDGPLYLGNVFLGFKNGRRQSMEGSFAVREGTKIIAASAFNGADFSNVVLPDSVSYIGDEAFLGCEKLTRITIPKHLVSIGNRAFDGCHALISDLAFPDGVHEIGYHAFRECSKIESASFPLSLETIDHGAFDRCQFKSMILPPLFASTNKYGDIALRVPHTVEFVKLIGEWRRIPNKLFSGQRNLKKIDFADSSIMEIGNGAFEYCEALEEIHIPKTVASIGNNAFSGCKKLRSVKLPDQLTDIKDSLFSNCSLLESVSIPLAVTNIGSYAFYDCPSLKSISIPDSVDIISNNAFDKKCHLEKSEKRRGADQIAAIGEAEKLFAKRCKVGNGEAQVEYEGVQYAIVKNTRGGENFVIATNASRSSDLAGSFMIFASHDSRDGWYAAVGKCVEKIKSWARVAAENKVKQVCKEIPVYAEGNLDEVYAYVNAISRGQGQQELFGKTIREPITPLSATQPVKFVGAIEMRDDAFTRYRISIRMICGNYFDGEIFYAGGTMEEIGKQFVEFLVFVNPESLENARKKQAEKEALFN